MRKYLPILSMAILIIGSCASKKVDKLEEVNIPSITFSAGGGFAGTYTTYVLLENGQIFKQGSSTLNAKPVGQISKDEAKQIFHNYDFLKLSEKDQISYGNYTYSITKKIDGKAHKLIWEKDQGNTDLLQTYFKNAMRAIAKNKVEVTQEKKEAKKSFKPQKEAKKQ